MIDLGRPALHGESITVFFDHADPVRFYCLPDCPRLRLDADGRPELSLLKYRLDPELHEALGAGLLSLTVDLGVDQEQLDRILKSGRYHTVVGNPPYITVKDKALNQAYRDRFRSCLRRTFMRGDLPTRS